ncbi:MAG TPA: hypothetical protein VGD78_02480 [Chthoniobacterales bacterium]
MKSPIRFLVLAALATYFSIPLANKVKAEDPVDLTDVGPAAAAWLLALIGGFTGGKARPAANA